MMRSIVRTLKTLMPGIAALYACLIFYNIVVWLPVHYAADPWRYYVIESVLFYFPGFFRGLMKGEGPLLPLVWEAILGPVLVMVAGVFAALKVKGRLRVIGPDLILLSSFSLTSLLVGLVVNDLGRWFDPSSNASFGLPATRVSLVGVVGSAIIVVNSWSFYRLYRNGEGSWMSRLAAFFLMFFLPSAIVTLSAELQLANIWSLFLPRSPRWDWMTFEGWQLIFLPVISIGALATLSGIIAPRILNWLHSYGPFKRSASP